MVTGSQNVQRGALIVFEGLDRVGKSTQAQKLLRRIEESGKKAELMKFPDRSTHIGKSINDYLTNSSSKLNDRAIHLLFSANRWEKIDEMEQKLKSGISLIVDRYAFSGAAYTCAKPGFSMPWCMNPDRGLLKPDLVLFMMLNPDKAKSRGDYGAERYEKVDFQKQVLENFMLLKDDYWEVVDADNSIESIHEQIVRKYQHIVDCGTLDDRELNKLWIEDKQL
ncbi:thymidylate kinase-like [Convolutriloba macropyga]|uniref:thymidylate kinase-like n=1 Tax=Convolutriloba macropyga TaxID=536237 RepID=UPI003F520782